ncbi:signal peptidase I [Paraliobacillus sediminis]|uniref:signal peptidase I n=1 Tax=Paraliobacillus sediminis TaxID=1885916 RepID=UPI000E3B9C2B|nr:signal peptidase I [Paraliobacillus sediminis]
MHYSAKMNWKNWIKFVLLALILVILLTSFIFSTSVIEGDSMQPTLQNGEQIVYNKIAYLVNEPQRGDIVIIDYPLKNYIKRIIGLPNETIEIREQQLYINNLLYQQSFLTEAKSFTTDDFGPITIPDKSYFVMGDNRQISKDSRNGLGFIRSEEIIGNLEFVINPNFKWKLVE